MKGERKMHKLLVFDLDGTLAAVGKGMKTEDAEKLIALENCGYQIAICSGKPTYYLCGFIRQLGLKEAILVGENGAVFQFGIELPPKRYEVYPHSESAKAQKHMMKSLIDREFGNKIWYQPNEVALTPFPKDKETFEELQKLINEKMPFLDELLVYRHIDCFDLSPQNINKYNGLEYLAKLMGLSAKDVVAVGDGVNDIPMFAFADISIGVGKMFSENELAREKTDYFFEEIGQVLDFIHKERI